MKPPFISIFEYSNKLEIGDGGVWGSKKRRAKEEKREREMAMAMAMA